MMLYDALVHSYVIGYPTSTNFPHTVKAHVKGYLNDIVVLMVII